MSEVEITGIFDDVLGMIHSAKQKAEYQVNSTTIDLYWSIGEYVSKQIDVNGWGKSTVKALSDIYGVKNLELEDIHHKIFGE